MAVLLPRARHPDRRSGSGGLAERPGGWIRLDQIADSFVLVAHLEPVSVAAEIEESLLSAG
jgi:hypothetical protein